MSNFGVGNTLELSIEQQIRFEGSHATGDGMVKTILVTAGKSAALF